MLPQQLFDDSVKRAIVQLYAALLTALAHGGGHLVGMHGPLVQEDENGQGQGVGKGALSIRHRIYCTKYSYTSIRRQGLLSRRCWTCELGDPYFLGLPRPS